MRVDRDGGDALNRGRLTAGGLGAATPGEPGARRGAAPGWYAAGGTGGIPGRWALGGRHAATPATVGRLPTGSVEGLTAVGAARAWSLRGRRAGSRRTWRGGQGTGARCRRGGGGTAPGGDGARGSAHPADGPGHGDRTWARGGPRRGRGRRARGRGASGGAGRLACARVGGLDIGGACAGLSGHGGEVLRVVAGELNLPVGVHGPLDVRLGEARGEGDGGGRSSGRSPCPRGHVDDAVGVDLEGHLDLHLAAVADAEAGELELAQHLALVGLVRLALVDADLHLLLAVAAGGEGLRLVDRDGRVLVDDLLGVAAHRADAQRERGDVDQEGLGRRRRAARAPAARRPSPPPGRG